MIIFFLCPLNIEFRKKICTAFHQNISDSFCYVPDVTSDGSRHSVRQKILNDEECSEILIDSELPIARIDRNIRKIVCGLGSTKKPVSTCKVNKYFVKISSLF